MVIEIDTRTGTGPPIGKALRKPQAFAMSCFVIWGLAYGLLDVLNKHFQETLHIGKARSAWLQIAYFGAYLLMSVPAGWTLQARGYKGGLIIGLMITALGAFLFVPAASVGSFVYFVGSMFVMATGLCFLETAADTYVNVLGPPEHASQRLNLAQSFNALGVFFGPLIGGATLFSSTITTSLGGQQTAVKIIYATIGICVLLFAAVLATVYLPEIQENGHASVGASDAVGTSQSSLRQKHFTWGVITQGLYVGAQVGIGAFFLNLVTETWTGMTSQQGAYLLSIGMIGYLLGRFSASAILLKVQPRVLLTCYGLANVALCLTVSAGIQKVSALALVAVFFFMAPMFPTIFALGVRNLGAHTKRGASLMVMAIGGGVLLPYPMGLVADLHGTPTAFLLPAVSFACVALYGWRGSRLATYE